MIAFECVIEEEMHVYITVERDGTDLAYNCFRDKEVSVNMYTTLLQGYKLIRIVGMGNLS
jgi:hypothetical protein